MGADSKIEWTDHTFNPWWGCQKVSAGCTNCYAEAFAKRTGHAVFGPATTTGRRLFGDKHWAEPLKWDKAAEKGGERKRVFCASMADVFEDHPALPEHRARLWQVIEATYWLDWLLLTKRPENIRKMVPARWLAHPLPHVWYGTTIESQDVLDQRATALLSTPGRVHFFSCEPLLGPLDIRGYRPRWIIAGGESGAKARPWHIDWARSLRDQAKAAGIPYFWKQHGEFVPAWSDDGDPFYAQNGAQYDIELPDRRVHVWRSGLVPHTEDCYYCDASIRVGKARAGALLDGVEHKELPHAHP